MPKISIFMARVWYSLMTSPKPTSVRFVSWFIKTAVNAEFIGVHFVGQTGKFLEGSMYLSLTLYKSEVQVHWFD